MIELVNNISQWAIPIIVAIILVTAITKKVNVYDTFTEGAVEGIGVGVKILPYLVAMLMAISIFRASGALDLLLGVIAPISTALGIPEEVVPLALLRPLSGTASLGIVSDLISEYGPDSFIGRLASTMQGSTETTFYVAALYFGSVGIKRSRHSIVAGLIADFVGFLAAVFICKLVFF
ncbi:spore maturation protein [Halonatronum saccharophilum]|uniref:spore maturation protein n=1 Tax=Halonatronum saccharophilum TaxID=150060 RepID=UPI000481FF4D|nr:spore maturation protein [Halonatronum saccharophilum]